MPNSNPQQVGKYLEQCATKNRTIYYSEVVNHFGLPELDGAWIGHPLADIFEVLDQQDANQKRPFRTSVVISKEKKMPGNGFFEALSRLKNIQATNQIQRDVVFNAELSNAFAFPW